MSKALTDIQDFIHDHEDHGTPRQEGDNRNYLDEWFNFSAMQRSLDKEAMDLMSWTMRFQDNLPGSYMRSPEYLRQALTSYKRGDSADEASAAIHEGRWKE